ncbi:AbrB/MazE/SpoVT family DNA-binding domain-containing protein [Novosphingobium aerophilum]|uniref:AbrB/MazE/SpoVT family DNA-binding domain-containing protein n=1 Tax=Novosphingobium aerophilum TaxID=2839843 RepID=UPI001F3450DD|nr:AbrB/MazE/SpoVT family DNA-binding domain-containing protein [Novosphingobium aerophilum]
MTVQVTITPNGRMSLPADIRKRLGLAAGGALLVEETDDGVPGLHEPGPVRADPSALGQRARGCARNDRRRDASHLQAHEAERWKGVRGKGYT